MVCFVATSEIWTGEHESIMALNIAKECTDLTEKAYLKSFLGVIFSKSKLYLIRVNLCSLVVN